MKILLIEYRDITHPEAGGAELILFEIFSQIVQAGHQVDYLCCQYAGAKPEEIIQGIRVIRRGISQLVFNFTVPIVYFREIKKNKYHIIIEGIDKLPFYMPLFERNTPTLCIIPHLFGKAIFKEVPFIFGAYVYSYELLIPHVYKSSYFSALSKSTEADLIARGLPPEQVRVIYTGLTQADYSAPHTHPLSDHPIVIYLGRIKKYKGVDLGMKAIKKLQEKYPNIEYQIVGSGDYVADLKQLAAELDLDKNVSFLGVKTGAEKTELLQKANVLIYASPKEGWGLSVIEANACGTPVVASNSPGLRESVVDGETGFLTPHGDTDALAEKIDLLLSDPDLYDQMREKAIQWGQSFSWERAAEETLDLIRHAIEVKNEIKVRNGGYE
ncbi:MAG: hypothetical protein B6244_11570 [Candidatus Cloacimonetes bacterium 4572_55]|nr:MAG: hypothetical protein B6244_11570 [Candidatus Cloacimonetes bacterium 4572_55]